jgi:hypothetical protein
VNLWVNCTVTTSVCCVLLVVFLATNSLDFPVEIFLVTYDRDTLIKKWDAQGTEISEGVHSLGWTSQDEEIL